MKIFILFLLVWNSTSAQVAHKELLPQHPFSAMTTREEFTHWCEVNNLLPYSDYFLNRPLPELLKFLSLTQRVLHPLLGRAQLIDRAINVLSDALMQSPNAPVEAINTRAKNDLAIYRPLARAYYKYALTPNAVFEENRTLNSQGKLQLVLGPWELPKEALDPNFERASYAHDIIRMEPGLSEFTDSEKLEIKKWSAHFDEVMEDRYSGHNAKLKEIRFKEIKLSPTPNQGSLDDFIQSFAFGDTSWWMISSTRVFGEATAATNIRGVNSRSLLRRLGPEATRVIYWPLETKEREALPVLGKLHIAVNLDARNRMRSIEVLALDSQGKVQPFMYERVRTGQRSAWLPVKTLNNVEIKNVCMKCHQNAQGEMGFRPSFLTNEGIMKDIGYQSTYIREALLRL